ncbi:MAG: hypothetical protein ACI81L_000091 [Verrucomicrobiales bacterium]|jgi:hypothetical protein
MGSVALLELLYTTEPVLAEAVLSMVASAYFINWK